MLPHPGGNVTFVELSPCVPGAPVIAWGYICYSAVMRSRERGQRLWGSKDCRRTRTTRRKSSRFCCLKMFTQKRKMFVERPKKKKSGNFDNVKRPPWLPKKELSCKRVLELYKEDDVTDWMCPLSSAMQWDRHICSLQMFSVCHLF